MSQTNKRYHYDKGRNCINFQIRSGAKLTINANLINKDNELSVFIVAEDDKNYTVVTFDGFQFSFPKDLVELNDSVEIINNKIFLTEDIYENWCIKKDKTAVAIRQRFIDGIDVLLKNKELILQNANYFLIRVPGLFHINRRLFTIGEWLENLDQFTGNISSRNNQKDQVHKNCVIVGLGVSIISGSHSATGWCLNEQKLVQGTANCIRTIREYTYEHKRYLSLTTNRLHALMLLNELGI